MVGVRTLGYALTGSTVKHILKVPTYAYFIYKAKSPQGLRSVINATKKLWRQYHLTYDQTRYVSKEVRRALAIERTKIRQRVIARLSREEEARLITHAYRMKGERGLLIKTLFQTGARVSEFVNIKVEDVFFEEQIGVAMGARIRKPA
jgi:site-specific recombinase XerD